MTLISILNPDSDSRLWHPTIGEVDWKLWEYSGIRVLHYARGPEKGTPLVVDSEILWGEGWVELESSNR